MESEFDPPAQGHWVLMEGEDGEPIGEADMAVVPHVGDLVYPFGAKHDPIDEYEVVGRKFPPPGKPVLVLRKR